LCNNEVIDEVICIKNIKKIDVLTLQYLWRCFNFTSP
jgi:hypothetical protein